MGEAKITEKTTEALEKGFTAEVQGYFRVYVAGLIAAQGDQQEADAAGARFMTSMTFAQKALSNATELIRG